MGDETGDLVRENEKLWSERNFWGTFALFLLTIIVAFIVVFIAGGL